MKSALWIAVILISLCTVRAQSGQPVITRSVVAGGGTTLSSSNRFQLSSTVGQPATDVLNGNRFSVRQGFWIRRAPAILAPSKVGTDFVFTLQTELGKTYSVQYADSSFSPNWQTFAVVPGNGAVQSVTNAAPAATQRFYRVFEQ